MPSQFSANSAPSRLAVETVQIEPAFRRTIAIDRVGALDPHRFVIDYVAFGEPIVVTEHRAVDVAGTTWSLDYLVAKHPAHVVSVEYTASDDLHARWKHVRMDLHSYVELIRTDRSARGRYYLAEKPLIETFPNTAAEISVPALLDGQCIDRVSVFAGIDTYSAAHYHATPMEAVLLQLHGCKQLSLYSSSQLAALQPYPWYSMRSNWSRLRDAMPGETSMAVDATEYTCTLQPGEMLFIPQGWFHVTRGFGESVSVTYFFTGSWRHARLQIALRDLASTFEKRFILMPLRRAARWLVKGVQRLRAWITYFTHDGHRFRVTRRSGRR